MPIGATPLATLVASIQADPSPLYRTLGSVRSALPGLLSLGGISGVSIGIGFAAKQSIQLEQALTNLDQVTDLTSGQLKGLGTDLEQLAIKMKTVPVARLFDIATAGAKLGYSGEVLLQYTEGIIKASSAIKELPVGILSDDLGRLNNQFKLGSDGAFFLASAIGKVASSGTSAPEQILDIASRISGLATVSKITAPEVIALSGTIADSTKYSEAAAGALILLIQNLQDVESQKGFARTIGVSAEEFAKQVREKPLQSIQDFLKALKGLDAISQGVALKSIGIEGIRGLGNLEKLSQSFQDIGRYNEIASKEITTGAFAQRAYAKDAATTGAAISQLGNEITIAAKKFGDELTPSIRSASETIGPLIGRIPELISAFRELGESEASSRLLNSFSIDLPSAGSFLDDLVVTIRNFDLVWDETTTRIGVGANNLGVLWKGGIDLMINAFQFGLDYIGSWADSTYNAIVRMYNRVQPILKYLATPLLDLNAAVTGTTAGKIKLNPLAETKVRVPEFKAPELKFQDIDEALAGNRAELQRRADARAAENFGKGVTSGTGRKEAAIAAAAEAGGKGTLAGEGKENQQRFQGLEEFAKRLQTGALGGADVPKQQLDVQKQALKVNQEVAAELKAAARDRARIIADMKNKTGNFAGDGPLVVA